MDADPLRDRARAKAGGAASSAANAVKDGAKDHGQDKQKMLLSSDAGHFSMIRALHLADVITCGNLYSGFVSISCSVRYAAHVNNPFSLAAGKASMSMWMALLWIPIGLGFDFFDGKVARWRGKSSLMGQELDSLADLVSFGVAPATAAFALGLNTAVDHCALAFFVLCALTRLARFNVTVSLIPKDASGKSRYFEGFPAPTSLCIVAWMALWLRDDAHIPGGVWAADTPFVFHPAVAIFPFWGCLMTSRTIHVPKP